jgi:hypothetical protein
MLSRVAFGVSGMRRGVVLVQKCACSAISVETPVVPAADQASQPKKKPVHKHAGKARSEPISIQPLNKAKTQDDIGWVYLSGFSKFASRRDLQLLLREHKPAAIDPVVSPVHYFSGVYGLKFNTPAEQHAFQAYIDEMKLKGSAFRVHPSNIPQYSRMSTVHMGPNTVRVDPCFQTVSPDHLVTLFEDYGVANKDIKKVGFMNKFSHFLINFKTVEDAQRAFVEHDKKFFLQDIMKLIIYQA